MSYSKDNIAKITSADDIIKFQERLKQAIINLHLLPDKLPKRQRRKGKPTNITPKKKRR